MSSASPVSNIDASEILAAIGKLETDLAKMKVALGATGVVVPKARKSAKAPAADGEKKAPNAWIVFTQKVDGALKAASIATGAATVGKQFASSLKDIKPYAEWTDEAIVAAWSTWEKPAPKPKASASSASESEEGASAAAPKKERKKRAPMTAEAKAAAKLKRDAKKAAAAGGAPASASEESEEEEDAPSQPPAPPAAAPPAPPAEPPVKAFAKKVVGAAKPAFTLEQLADFTPKDIDGAENGVNCRGDVVDGDGNYLGHWNSKTKVLSRGAAPPADWQAILDAMNA
jgi:hypothetical protein